MKLDNIPDEVVTKIKKYIIYDWSDSIIQSQLKESMSLKISINSIKRIRANIAENGQYDPQKTKYIRKNADAPQGDLKIIFDKQEEEF